MTNLKFRGSADIVIAWIRSSVDQGQKLDQNMQPHIVEAKQNVTGIKSVE